MSCVVALFCSLAGAAIHPQAIEGASQRHTLVQFGDFRGSTSRSDRPQAYFFIGATSNPINDAPMFRYFSNSMDPRYAAPPAFAAGLSADSWEIFLAAAPKTLQTDANAGATALSKDSMALSFVAKLKFSEQSTLTLELFRTNNALSHAGANHPQGRSWAGDGVVSATLNLRF